MKPFRDPLAEAEHLTTPMRAAPARGRLRVVALVVALVFLGLALRATQLAFSGAPALATRPEAPSQRSPGRVLDRNGALLIGAGQGQVLIARRELVWDPRATAEALAQLLPGLDASALAARLIERERGVVYVRRGLTQAQAQAALDLGLAGLSVEPEPRRVYPNGPLAGQTLGYTDIDLEPLSGVERGMASLIDGQEVVRLSLDLRVQHAVEAELAAGAEAAGARSGAMAVLDGRTGEILALASWPFLDPNRQGGASEEARRHHAVGARYELGSSLKPLTFAMALDAGVFLASELFDTADGVQVEGRVIQDSEPALAPIGLEEALARSSNVAAAMAALRVGGPLQTQYLERLGFDARFDIGLPEAAAHRLAPPRGPTDVAARGYGYGMLLSPLSLASAYTVFVNDGRRVSLTLRPRLEAEAEYFPVFSPESARIVREAMARALPEGTGWRAASASFGLAGKTGTARRLTAQGAYEENRVVASFAAVFPAAAPRFVLAVVVDEPVRGVEEGAGPTGGGVAAPIAGRAALRIAPFLGLFTAQAAPQATGEASP